PFRFFAALMPPCAQTECERLTGTIENNCTGTPDSATRIVAMSPARPPPTMMILGSIIKLSYRLKRPRHFHRRRRPGLKIRPYCKTEKRKRPDKTDRAPQNHGYR